MGRPTRGGSLAVTKRATARRRKGKTRRRFILTDSGSGVEGVHLDHLLAEQVEVGGSRGKIGATLLAIALLGGGQKTGGVLGLPLLGFGDGLGDSGIDSLGNLTLD